MKIPKYLDNILSTGLALCVVFFLAKYTVNTVNKDVYNEEKEWQNKYEPHSDTISYTTDTLPRMASYDEDITLSDGRVKTVVRICDRYDGVINYFVINKH